MNTDDIVFEKDGQWWFWDETYSEYHGPFDTKEESIEACIKYSTEVLGV